MILRFEDATAIKHRINFYLGKDSKLKIVRANGFIVGVEYGKLPLKGGITFDELLDV